MICKDSLGKINIGIKALTWIHLLSEVSEKTVPDVERQKFLQLTDQQFLSTPQLYSVILCFGEGNIFHLGPVVLFSSFVWCIFLIISLSTPCHFQHKVNSTIIVPRVSTEAWNTSRLLHLPPTLPQGCSGGTPPARLHCLAWNSSFASSFFPEADQWSCPRHLQHSPREGVAPTLLYSLYSGKEAHRLRWCYTLWC